MGEGESFNAHGVGGSDERSRRAATLSFPFYGLNASTVFGNTLDYGLGLFGLISSAHLLTVYFLHFGILLIRLMREGALSLFV